MSVFSSGSKWKYAAQTAMGNAEALANEQQDINFRRDLLSNIRENRMANAMISVGNYSDDYSSSSVAGARANVNSALAGDVGYSYDSSLRAELIQDYTDQAQDYMQKYADQQKKKGMAYSITGMVAGAALGGLGAGLAAGGLTATQGALVGSQLGQGLGQLTSKTGQEEQGIQNILGSASSAYNFNTANKIKDGYIQQANKIASYLGSRGYSNRYQVASLMSNMEERDVEIITLFGGY